MCAGADQESYLRKPWEGLGEHGVLGSTLMGWVGLELLALVPVMGLRAGACCWGKLHLESCVPFLWYGSPSVVYEDVAY